jgi:hypothetical protein
MLCEYCPSSHVIANFAMTYTHHLLSNIAVNLGLTKNLLDGDGDVVKNIEMRSDFKLLLSSFGKYAN